MMLSPREPARLTVYGKALDLSELLDRLSDAIPERRIDLRDQLRRASASVALNIAEGAGEFSPGDKARFYRIARRSAAECGGILDVLERTDSIRCDLAQERTLLHDVGAMLTGLILAHERRR